MAVKGRRWWSRSQRLLQRAFTYVRQFRPLRWFSPGDTGGATGPGEEIPEAELILQAKAGGNAGKQAFGLLVLRHQSWLVRYLYFLLGGSTEAEDVAQEALVRAFLALDRFRGESSFKTWIRPIATRLAFNHRRDNATRQRYEDMLEIPESTSSGDMGLISRDVLLKVLNDLSYAYREILVLRYVEELSVQEVSVALDIGLSATKMRLSRARDGFWDVYKSVSGEDSA